MHAAQGNGLAFLSVPLDCQEDCSAPQRTATAGDLFHACHLPAWCGTSGAPRPASLSIHSPSHRKEEGVLRCRQCVGLHLGELLRLLLQTKAAREGEMGPSLAAFGQTQIVSHNRQCVNCTLTNATAAACDVSKHTSLRMIRRASPTSSHKTNCRESIDFIPPSTCFVNHGNRAQLPAGHGSRPHR